MKELQQLMKRGNNFLGTKVPIMCGAMTWISDVDLVKAVNNAGAFGILAGGNMPPELLKENIDLLKKTEKSFGINLITIAPNYGEHLQIACKKEAPCIIFAGSFPKASGRDGGSYSEFLRAAWVPLLQVRRWYLL